MPLFSISNLMFPKAASVVYEGRRFFTRHVKESTFNRKIISQMDATLLLIDQPPEVTSL